MQRNVNYFKALLKNENSQPVLTEWVNGDHYEANRDQTQAWVNIVLIFPIG